MNPLRPIQRAFDDLNAIARRLDEAPRAIVDRLDDLLGRLDDLRAGVAPVPRLLPMLDDLRREVEPIRELRPVRTEIQGLREQIERVESRLEGLQEQMQPIQHLKHVRAGIEPLDDDLHEVRTSIERIEPLADRISSLVEGIDRRLGEMGDDLAPVGDLAEKVPGVSRG